jgi:hypothetical protein
MSACRGSDCVRWGGMVEPGEQHPHQDDADARRQIMKQEPLAEEAGREFRLHLDAVTDDRPSLVRASPAEGEYR